MHPVCSLATCPSLPRDLHPAWVQHRARDGLPTRRNCGRNRRSQKRMHSVRLFICVLQTWYERTRFSERAREAEENSEAERQGQSESEARQTPSPTHVSSRFQQQQTHVRPTHTHQRRESDTLRSGPTPQALAAHTQEHDIESQPLPPRLSPSARQYVNAPPLSTSLGSRHRRSPTAPDAPTTSSTLAPTSSGRDGIGKTWAGEKDGYERERERAVEDFGEHQARPSSVIPTMQPQLQPQQQMQPPPSAPDVKTRNLVVCYSIPLSVVCVPLFIDNCNAGKQEAICASRHDWQGWLIARVPRHEQRK